MSTSRYEFTRRVQGGRGIGTIKGLRKIYFGVMQGNIPSRSMTLKEAQRLDHIAGRAYGDSSLWWVIAAASGIGWGLQVPPGTILKIPIDLSKVYSLIR